MGHKLMDDNITRENLDKVIEFLQQEPIPNIPIFTIRGEGCTTFGSDGDGIVQSASVPLNYSQNFAFNSICSLTGGAHMNLLNPYKNPEIYSKIKEILDE